MTNETPNERKRREAQALEDNVRRVQILGGHEVVIVRRPTSIELDAQGPGQQLSASDARKLAQMLLAEADHLEERIREKPRKTQVRGSSGHVRVLEELCNDDRCGDTRDTHWHEFSVEDFLKESAGEYTVTLRVRVVGRKSRARKKHTSPQATRR